MQIYVVYICGYLKRICKSRLQETWMVGNKETTHISVPLCVMKEYWEPKVTDSRSSMLPTYISSKTVCSFSIYYIFPERQSPLTVRTCQPTAGLMFTFHTQLWTIIVSVLWVMCDQLVDSHSRCWFFRPRLPLKISYPNSLILVWQRTHTLAEICPHWGPNLIITLLA